MMGGQRMDVAVFPLVNAVLFPGVTLSLHFFERHHLQMLRDIQAKGWLLAVSLIQPFSDRELMLNGVCGAGRIEIIKEYHDGRCDVLVKGTQRVRLRSFIQQEPYFVMDADPIDDLGLAALPLLHNGQRNFADFLSLVKSWAFLNPALPEKTPLLFDDFKNFGELADFFVFHFLKRAPDKQVYLNCTDPSERSEKLARYLETDLVRLSRRNDQLKRLQMVH